MTNFPWPMDKPIDSFAYSDGTPDNTVILYLIERVKLAEGGRDSYRELYREADNKWNKD